MGILDIDICGPSVPRMMGVEDQGLHVYSCLPSCDSAGRALFSDAGVLFPLFPFGAEVRKSNFGWSPVYAADNLGVMSVGFMLGSKNDAVIWRGPRKNG